MSRKTLQILPQWAVQFGIGKNKSQLFNFLQPAVNEPIMTNLLRCSGVAPRSLAHNSLKFSVTEKAVTKNLAKFPMKTLMKKLSVASAAALLLMVGAQATPLTIQFNTHFVDVTGSYTDNSGDLQHSSIPLHTEPDDGQEGTLASFYQSTWTESGGDITNVVISHVDVSAGQTTPPSTYIGNPEIFVIAGQAIWQYDPSLNGGAVWDGWMPLTIDGLPAIRDSNARAISHVDITGSSVRVPEGGSSLALLGLSLLGLARMRRVR